ncbi:MAG TPA: hypothetical protein VFV33_09475 [Gemmatimonadaceae bacterium]|nr:hypothetical protein [Gemmatimonadaceae bacterium]
MTPSHPGPGVLGRSRDSRAVVGPTARLVLALALLAGCAPPSKQDIESAQAIAQLGDAYNDVRLTQQELQDQIDSLKTVAIRQDSVIRALANLAGVPLPR